MTLQRFAIGFILLLTVGCKSNEEISMERGEYFYNTDQLEFAIQEYKNVTTHYNFMYRIVCRN